MTVVYLITLAISAWVMAYGLTWLFGRVSQIRKHSLALPEGAIALGVTLAMLLIVAAPTWLWFAFLALAGLSFFQSPLPSLRRLLLMAALPLALSPLIGMQTAFALDAILIAAAVFGETYAS